MAEQDESSLITRCQKGDTSSFGVIFERYKRQVYLIALQMVGNKQDALDMSQVAFMKAFSNMAKFDKKKVFGPWIFRILRNQCIDFLRRGKDKKEVSLEKHVEIEDNRYNPDLLLERDERKERIWSALNTLNHHHREIIVLKDFQDMNYKQISEILDIPIGTVMSRLNAARSQLKTILEGSL